MAQNSVAHERRVVVYLRPNVFVHIKQHVADKKVSKSAVMNEALRDYLQKNSQNNSGKK